MMRNLWLCSIKQMCVQISCDEIKRHAFYKWNVFLGWQTDQHMRNMTIASLQFAVVFGLEYLLPVSLGIKSDVDCSPYLIEKSFSYNWNTIEQGFICECLYEHARNPVQQILKWIQYRPSSFWRWLLQIFQLQATMSSAFQELLVTTSFFFQRFMINL